MNRKLIPLLFVLIAAFQGCRGPEGPQGPAGDAVVGTTIDVTGVNFNNGNNYEYSTTFAQVQLEVLESDALLIYSHWEDVESGGQTVKSFRLLPQTAFVGTNQILTYNYDQTVRDFRIFLDGNFNLANAGGEYTQNQNFRLVVVPSDFAARTSGKLDYSDYNAVAKALNIDESKVIKVVAK